MSKLSYRVGDTRRRVAAMAEITRWVWSVNAIVMVYALCYHQYALALLATFGFLPSLFASALGRQAIRRLRVIERAAGMQDEERSQSTLAWNRLIEVVTNENSDIYGVRRDSRGHAQLYQQKSRRPMNASVQPDAGGHSGGRVRAADCPGRGQMMLP